MNNQAIHPHRYYLVVRLSLAIIFIMGGLNGFYPFLKMPPFTPQGAAFVAALKESGIFWTLVNLVELSAGVLLLFGALGQLAVLALAPITIGIFAFHTFLSPPGAWLGIVALVLEIILLWIYRRSLKSIFKTQAGHPRDSLE